VRADAAGATHGYSPAMAVVLGGNDFADYAAVTSLAERVRLEIDADADAAFPDRFLARVTVPTVMVDCFIAPRSPPGLPRLRLGMKPSAPNSGVSPHPSPAKPGQARWWRSIVSPLVPQPATCSHSYAEERRDAHRWSRE
jgi:hypothetical protein